MILDRQAALAAFRSAAETVKESLTTLERNGSRLKTDAAVLALAKKAKELFERTQAVEKAFKTGTTGEAN